MYTANPYRVVARLETTKPRVFAELKPWAELANAFGVIKIIQAACGLES